MSPLGRAFCATATALGSRDERVQGEVYHELFAAYEGEPREYHTIEHVEECLALLDEVRGTLESPDEVAMALWFHDAVYGTYPFAASERRSASFARRSCARLGIPQESIERIAAMILGTKSHELPEGKSPLRKHDALTMFDIDLARLGGDPVAYAYCEKWIRDEYAWVPEGIFRSLRAKTLRGFLERPAIYRTPFFHEHFEARARANLQRAIAELTAKTDDLVLHATDDYLFATRAARLEVQHSWSDLHYASIVPGPRSTGPRLGVAFAPDDDRALQIALDDPHASEILDRLRSIPDYDRGAEHRGRTTGLPAIVYSYERHARVERPLRASAGAAYRDR